MKKYKVIFMGRLRGADGIRYRIEAEVRGADQEAALLALYDHYEHISNAYFEEVI